MPAEAERASGAERAAPWAAPDHSAATQRERPTRRVYSEHGREHPAAQVRPLPAEAALARGPGRRDQEVRRRQRRQAGGARRLLHVSVPVSAVARLHDGARLRARRQPKSARIGQAVGPRPVPGDRRLDQRQPTRGQHGGPDHRRRAVVVRRTRGHRSGPLRARHGLDARAKSTGATSGRGFGVSGC